MGAIQQLIKYITLQAVNSVPTHFVYCLGRTNWMIPNRVSSDCNISNEEFICVRRRWPEAMETTMSITASTELKS